VGQTDAALWRKELIFVVLLKQLPCQQVDLAYLLVFHIHRRMISNCTLQLISEVVIFIPVLGWTARSFALDSLCRRNARRERCYDRRATLKSSMGQNEKSTHRPLTTHHQYQYCQNLFSFQLSKFHPKRQSDLSRMRCRIQAAHTEAPVISWHEPKGI
jgi:hypothetical protein